MEAICQEYEASENNLRIQPLKQQTQDLKQQLPEVMGLRYSTSLQGSLAANVEQLAGHNSWLAEGLH